MENNNKNKNSSLKIYKNMTAFVGHSFDENDADLVNAIKYLLSSFGVKCDSGEKPEGQKISEKIINRIKRNDIFVGIFTRRDKLSDTGKWVTAPWIIEEKAVAILDNKLLILLKEEGVKDIGGLQADYEYVLFNRDCFYKAIPKIIDYITSFTLKIEDYIEKIKEKDKKDINSPKENISEPFDNINSYIKLSKRYLIDNDLTNAEKILKKGLDKFPNSADIKFELAYILRLKKEYEESLALYIDLINLNPVNDYYHNNIAKLYQDMGNISKSIDHFRKAIEIDPNAENLKCYGIALFQSATDFFPVRHSHGPYISYSIKYKKEDIYRKAKNYMNMAKKLDDEIVNKELEKYILYIDKYLEEQK